MRIPEYEEKRVIEKSGFDFEEMDFGVKSPSFIFDILCNKMYQTPLRTMIQEYMSNARDAHREIGKADVAIEVTLPTYLDPNLRIRDFGPGLSPSRIKDVFVYLGESTKRKDNTQTGGFGVGAKVGWAYGDSFVVTSITPAVSVSDDTDFYSDMPSPLVRNIQIPAEFAEFPRIARTYLMYLGDTGIGKLSKLDEKYTNAPQGVEVQINIKESDFRATETAVCSIAHFWRPNVVIYNRSGVYFPHEGSIKNISCSVVPGMERDKYIAVVDGIPYQLDKNQIKNIRYNIGPDNSSMAACFFFNVGELDLAANREGLKYTEKTINCVNDHIEYLASLEKQNFDDMMRFSFTIDEKRAAISKYFEGVHSRNTVRVDVIPHFLYFQAERYDRRARSVYINSPNRRDAYKTGVADKWEDIKMYRLYRNSDVKTGVSSSLIGTNYSSSLCLNGYDTFYVLQGTESPSKNKARTLLKLHDDIYVIVVPNSYAYNQLIGVGMQAYEDVKDTFLPTETARREGYNFAEDDVKLVTNRGVTKKISNLNPEKDAWCHFKGKNEFSEDFNTLGLNRTVQLWYITQEQEEVVVAAGIPHASQVIRNSINQINMSRMANSQVVEEDWYNRSPSLLHDMLDNVDKNIYTIFGMMVRADLFISEMHQALLLGKKYITFSILSRSKTVYLRTQKVKTDRTANYAAKQKYVIKRQIEANFTAIERKFPLVNFISFPNGYDRDKKIKQMFEQFKIYVQSILNA